MSFEFTLLDALQALRCPVLDALAVFFDQAGAHGDERHGQNLYPRPCDLRPEMLTLVARPHGWSFPSGHTSSAFAAAFALWLQNRRLGVPALALAGFIGFTRMYLYVHFPTDILGGVALGLALGACGSLLADKISNKWAKRSEVKRTV